MTDKETRSERVYTGIREEILSGRRKPGDRLPTAELCKEFDSSVGVVRESLLRLVEHGLVQVRPMQGFRVVDLSAEDLRDLTEARLDIETLALRYSVEQGDAAWESQLVGVHHLLSVTPRQSPDSDERFTAEWGRAHGSFHAALLGGCRNRRILSIAHRLRDSAELYRRWSVAVDTDDGRDITGEHREILDAVLARDADLAVERLSAHIRRTDEVLRRGL
ncbi:GntR family transcriptional regulator [Streptomyces sp. NPDC007148]|uniref:GntR family transcriptional regulator n=1 Tax=unclassified Streptomyces TaxID=2593676 RepID=UPI0034197BF9